MNDTPKNDTPAEENSPKPETTPTSGEKGSSQAKPDTSATTSESSAPASEKTAAENNKVEKTETPRMDKKADTNAATAATPANVRQGATWPGKLGLLLSLVALGGTGYLYWQGWQLKQSNSTTQQSLTQQVETALAKNKADVAGGIAGVSQQLGQLQARSDADHANVQELQQRLTAAIKQVNATRDTSRKDWLLAEAEYLLRLANQRILMEKTANGALTLLKAADKILHETDDVALYDVRKALASDIAALDAVPRIDSEGLYLNLNAMTQQIPNLRVTPITDRHQIPAMLQEITPDTVKKSWADGARAAWSKTMDTLEKLVIIRHRDKPVEPLLSPQQTYFLQQNLQLMLEQAQLALLQRKQQAFEASLQKSEHWITTYFDAKNATTQSLLRGLKELETTNVSPKLPDISGSLKALKAYLKDMARLKQEAGK